MRMPRIVGPRSGSAVTSPRQVVNEPAPVAAEPERGHGATRSASGLPVGGNMAPRPKLCPLGCVRGGGPVGARRPEVNTTPPGILTIIDPVAGSGAWLAGVIGNPPWGTS